MAEECDEQPLSEEETEQLIHAGSMLRHVWRAMPNRVFAKPWERFGIGCVTRAYATLGWIQKLNNDGADCAVLARSLFEHVVAFAWMAEEPEIRLQMLLAKNADELRKTASELIALGTVEVDPNVIATADRERVGVRAPGVAAQAEAADKHWSARVPEFNWGFRRSYTSIFRPYSFFVHPTKAGVAGLFDPQGTLDFARCDTPVGHVRAGAASAFADALVVASETLGWPIKADLAATRT